MESPQHIGSSAVFIIELNREAGGYHLQLDKDVGLLPKEAGFGVYSWVRRTGLAYRSLRSSL